MSKYAVLNLSLIVLATGFGMYRMFHEPGRPAARHSVAEYRADASLLRTTFARCADDPGGLGKTPDCVNALEAERLESRGSLRGQVALGLDSSGR